MSIDPKVISLGREATRLEHDPAWVGSVVKAEALIVQEWANSHESEVGRREALHAELRALRRLRGALRSLIVDGAVQQEQVRRMR
jgi:hypothetical protein